MSDSISFLGKLKQLLQQEQDDDLSQYLFRVQSTSIKDRVEQGICWYPVEITKSYFGVAERLQLDIANKNILVKDHLLQPGACIGLFTNAKNGPLDKRQISGVVSSVRNNDMTITLNSDELPDWVDEGKLGVQLIYDEVTYKEMQSALDHVIKGGNGRLTELREVLCGNREAEFDDFKYVGIPGLNPSQNEALGHVLNAKDVAIVHGPPGTGKTTTLIECIAQAAKREKQLLVCAQSNNAVDLLSEKLIQRGINVVRIGHPARITESILNNTLDAKITQHPHFRDVKQLRKKAEEYHKLASKYKRQFGPDERVQRKMLYDEARKINKEAQQLASYIGHDVMEKAQVICSTLIGTSGMHLRNRHFDTLFIDEAAQALEPACWVAISKANRVILAGDHCQLPPTIKSVQAGRNGLAETLFERLMGKKNLSRMLEVQYRMHEHIMGFSSSVFYNSKLQAHDSVKSWLIKSEDSPIVFVDTAGCGFNEHKEQESMSTANEQEASFTINYLMGYLEGIGGPLEDLAPSVAIIAPYKAQVRALQQQMDIHPAVKSRGALININSVDAFQGQERDIICISLTRSNENGDIGFLSDTRRMNVALTRAKKKLILIGDSATICNHSFYQQFLDYMQEKGEYKSAYEYQEMWA